MEPIVSPWLIYLLEVIDNIRGVIVGTCVIAGMAALIRCIFVFIADGERDKDLAEKVKKLRFIATIFFIFLFITIFVPSRSTVIGMIVAKQITPNNVTKAIQTGKDFKNEIKKDIIDIIQSISKDKAEEGKK